MQIRQIVILLLTVASILAPTRAFPQDELRSDGKSQSRIAYAQEIDRSILAMGLDLHVESSEFADGVIGIYEKLPRVPAIILSGYLTRAIVFNLIQSTRILAGAKAAGFSRIYLVNTGHNDAVRWWMVDLLRAGPLCSDGPGDSICF